MKEIIIPTREEFHREFAGEIDLEDFCTSHPNKYRLNKLRSSLTFNHQNRAIAENLRRYKENAR